MHSTKLRQIVTSFVCGFCVHAHASKVPLDPLSYYVETADVIALVTVGESSSQREADQSGVVMLNRILSLKGESADRYAVRLSKELSIEPVPVRGKLCVFFLKRTKDKYVTLGGYAGMVCESNGQSDFIYIKGIPEQLPFAGFIDRVREAAKAR
jgi:hypothetical protein